MIWCEGKCDEIAGISKGRAKERKSREQVRSLDYFIHAQMQYVPNATWMFCVIVTLFRSMSKKLDHFQNILWVSGLPWERTKEERGWKWFSHCWSNYNKYVSVHPWLSSVWIVVGCSHPPEVGTMPWKRTLPSCQHFLGTVCCWIPEVFSAIVSIFPATSHQEGFSKTFVQSQLGDDPLVMPLKGVNAAILLPPLAVMVPTTYPPLHQPRSWLSQHIKGR